MDTVVFIDETAVALGIKSETAGELPKTAGGAYRSIDCCLD
jgi:hypothetical protein